MEQLSVLLEQKVEFSYFVARIFKIGNHLCIYPVTENLQFDGSVVNPKSCKMYVAVN